MSGDQLHRLDSPGDVGTLEIFLAVGTLLKNHVPAGLGEIHPSEGPHIGRLVYLELRAMFRPASGALLFSPLGTPPSLREERGASGGATL